MLRKSKKEQGFTTAKKSIVSKEQESAGFYQSNLEEVSG
jgi:hypothetical protein